MMKPLWTTLLLLIGGGATLQSAEYSKLWGRSGELWTPGSRLPDFSRAGYHEGAEPPVNLPRAASVKDFGAKGDGTADDTQAFLDALAQVKSGVIEVPPGRYRITRILEIVRPGIVLRGAGADKSILYFPVPLNEVKPNWGATTTGQRTSNYSWAGGYVWLRGSFQSKPLATVARPARRGDTLVTVSASDNLKVGQRIELAQSDSAENSLARHLYSEDPGAMANLKGNTRASLVCRIVAIDGSQVRLDRPLRFDLRPEWKPHVLSFEPTVTESGVENLCFEFPVTEYRGHFTELGFNPVALSGVADCWVRHIRIVNADSGPMVGGRFNTLRDIAYESTRRTDRAGNTGHHGASLSGDDNLFTEFNFKTRFIHDLTVSHCAGNVCSSGRGVDLCFDHHCRAPYENLFTDIDVGAGTRLWQCGGGAALGKHCGARGTFWNIRAARPLSYPSAGFGPPSMNLVGLHTQQPSETSLEGKWFEAIPPANLVPQNLHAAQRGRTLVPQIDGDWWQIVGQPDLGALTGAKQEPVDFAIWQAADGSWQLWSCIRNAKESGHTRLFHRWEGAKLTDPDWKPMGIAMRADAKFGEPLGGLQAPFVFQHDGRFQMFYGNWEDICRAISADGKQFTRVQNSEGKVGMFGEGPGTNTRDPMVLRIGPLWHCYYTAYPNRQGAVFARTSADWRQWSEPRVVNSGGKAGAGPFSAECPHVIERGGYYYLFRTERYGRNNLSHVYRSTDPLDFGRNEDAKYWVCSLPVAAPEIVSLNGQDYIAALNPELNGIRLAKLKWARADSPSASEPAAER